MNAFETTQNLLRERAELNARLKVFPYDGTPEIKEVSGKKYLYSRKRVFDKVTSTYVGVYSDELYNLLLRNAQEVKAIRKKLRAIEKELAQLGYSEEDVSPKVLLNLDYGRSQMKQIIYDQAVLEGVGTTFPDTEAIIENGKINNMTAQDVQKVLNLKHAWEFILDKDVASAPSDYYLCSHIARLVNEGFYQDGGRIRGVPVTIGGSSYLPPIPIETMVRESIDEIRSSSSSGEEIAIELLLYVMKTQIYNDGNKRTAVIFANHYMISHGLGLIAIPFDIVPEFKRLLVRYYEGTDVSSIKDFLRRCLLRI